MKIIIKEERRSVTIGFPNFIVFSPFASRIVKGKINGVNFSLFAGVSIKNIRKIRRCVKELKNQNKDWYLVELDSGDGASVKIKL